MKAMLIANPTARRLGKDTVRSSTEARGVESGGLEPALDELRRAGWSVTLRLTSGPGDATSIARRAVEDGADAVLVAGGDGTLNEAAQAVAGTPTALGYLPFGTVNIWARELGIPFRPRAAARAIVEGRIESIDLGVANDRYFLLMAGIGFDGEVVRRARAIERYKRRLGVLPYIAVGLSTVPLYRGADVELRYESIIRRVQALMIVVGNTRLYGGIFRFTPGAVANDGWLDLCIVKGKGSLALVRQSLPLLLSRTITHSDAEILRVRDLSVRTEQPLAFQLDGELVGSTPIQFHIAPRSLRAIVPKGFASDLIA